MPKVVVGLPVPKFEVGSAGAGVGLGGERDTGAPVRLRRICVSAPSCVGGLGVREWGLRDGVGEGGVRVEDSGSMV